MHPSVLQWVQGNLTREEVSDKAVAEVGSRDDNGTTQEIIFSHNPGTYLGIDIQPGPRVNIVCDAAGLPSCGSFDLVICTECLDHCEDWKSAVTGMVTALNPGGLWMLTTRSPGFPYHKHPDDYWRFTLEDMAVIAARTGMEIIDLREDPLPCYQGVFIKARKPESWTSDCIDLEDVTVAEVQK